MNSLMKVLVIILLYQGGQCSIVSNLLNYPTSEVLSSNNSLVNAPSNLSFSNVLNSLFITEDGLDLDLDNMIKKLNLNINLTSILTSLNVTLSDSGLVDLKSLFSYINTTYKVNMTDIFINLLNVKLTDDVLDLKRLIQNFKSVNLSEIISSLSEATSEDEFLDFVGLGQKYNLTVKTYNVTTEDGYILQIFHVPGNGPTVLCSHGLLDTSDAFLVRGRTSLVYKLAQNGFDVWAMNYRGNRYSKRHVKLNPDTDKVFWEYSMEEKGNYDLPAVINYVLEKTGNDKVSLIGHSQGTATGFVLFSTQPEFNKKINLFIAMSPVCYLSDAGTTLTVGIRLWPILNKILIATGIQELLAYDSVSKKVVQRLCLQGTLGYDLCVKVGFAAILGYSPDNLEPDFLPTFFGHFPAGASRKEVDHYDQIGMRDVFGQYDYESRNIKVYGSEIAPRYDLQNVTCNVSLVVSKNDKILGQKAAKRLQGELPNVVDYYLVAYDWFNHMDFVTGRNADEYVYQHVIELLMSYT